MVMFSADTTFFLTQIYIPRSGNNAFFSGNVSTGTDLVINFDLVKCITKININSYQTIMERWREDFHQKGKI